MRLLKRLKRSLAKRASRVLPNALRRDLLVYVGVNRGIGLDHVQGFYKRVVAVEADPNLAEFLRNKYRGNPRIEIHNFAVSEEDGEVAFHVSSNDGKSSSLLPLDTSHPMIGQLGIHSAPPVKVRSRPLSKFLREHGVTEITDYVSDIEDYDFTALRTLGKFVSERRIARIQMEVRSDDTTAVRAGAPDNRISSIVAFLDGRYRLVATGESYLTRGRFLESNDQHRYFDARFTKVDPG